MRSFHTPGSKILCHTDQMTSILFYCIRHSYIIDLPHNVFKTVKYISLQCIFLLCWSPTALDTGTTCHHCCQSAGVYQVNAYN